MAYFPIPDNPSFNVTQVEKVKPTDPVVDTHINPYFENFLNNDQYLKKKEEADAQLLQQMVSETKQTLQVEINKKLDGNGTVTDYTEAISKTETGTVPDTTIIARLYTNFLAGCRTIARAITGGRDGNGTGGVPTADNATPTVMAANIRKLAQINYNTGVESIVGTAPTFSGSFSSATPGSPSNYQVKATSDGYITNGTTAATRAATTTAQLEAPAESGVVEINVAPGIYNKVKLNLKKAYDAGVAAVKNVAATFSHAFSNNTAGAASNLNVTAATSGYVAANTTVRSIAAATSPVINTTAATGTQTINVAPGVYNKVQVNQKPAYDAGVQSVKVARKLTLSSAQTGSNIDIADNWYTTCDASAVYNKGVTDANNTVNTDSASYKYAKENPYGTVLYTDTYEGTQQNVDPDWNAYGTKPFSYRIYLRKRKNGAKNVVLMHLYFYVWSHANIVHASCSYEVRGDTNVLIAKGDTSGNLGRSDESIYLRDQNLNNATYIDITGSIAYVSGGGKGLPGSGGISTIRAQYDSTL